MFVIAITSALLVGFEPGQYSANAEANLQEDYCEEPHLDVATPLNDLGGNDYIRMDGQDTGEIGGLYPQGSNVRPAQHEADGVAVAAQIAPLDADGNPDEVNGKIVLVSIGMSNTAMEFMTFMQQANDDPDINPQLVLVNGAYPGRTADKWVDPGAEAWQYVYQLLSAQGLTPAQVQVAWVKLTHVGTGDFPSWPENLQQNLEIISRNLKTNFPNMRIAYYSSRTRSYTYWIGLNPEPSAYETGFSVRWMIEKQINGDPSLNFKPGNGDVVAPYLSWGPYLWIDGENPRSDGQVWLQEDMVHDCTHPSLNGRAKVAGMLMDYFKSDTTTVGWFLDAVPSDPSPTPQASSTPTSTPTATPISIPTSTATPTPRVTLEPPDPEPTSTNTPTALKLAPGIYIPVVSKGGIDRGSLDAPSLTVMMLGILGFVLVIKVVSRK